MTPYRANVFYTPPCVILKGDFLNQTSLPKNKVAWSVITFEAGIALENDIVFPARLSAVYVPGKWVKIANNKEEFRELLKTGLRLSPVFEVIIS